jgi:hypothetical protein
MPGHITLVTEDIPSEVLAHRLLAHVDPDANFTGIGRRGVGYVQSKLRSLNHAAAGMRIVAIADRDSFQKCPIEMIQAWLGGVDRHPSGQPARYRKSLNPTKPFMVLKPFPAVRTAGAVIRCSEKSHNSATRTFMTVEIMRIHPRPGAVEAPIQSDRGFELVDRRISGQKNKVENSTFVRSVDEAAYLVEQGFAIRMGATGKRPSLISPQSLRIIRK